MWLYCLRAQVEHVVKAPREVRLTLPAPPEVAVAVSARGENVRAPAYQMDRQHLGFMCLYMSNTTVRRYVFHAGHSYVV